MKSNYQFTILVITLILFSCNLFKTKTEEEKIILFIEEAILKTLNDPSSYEFASIEHLKPYTTSDSLHEVIPNKMQKALDKHSQATQLKILYAIDSIKYGPSSKKTQTAKNYLDIKDQADKLAQEFREIEKIANSENAASMIIANRAKLAFRANNEFGAKIYHSIIVRHNMNLNFIEIE